MQITVDPKFCIQLSEVYFPIVVTAKDVSAAICERDGIIEIVTDSNVVRIQATGVEIVGRMGERND